MKERGKGEWGREKEMKTEISDRYTALEREKRERGRERERGRDMKSDRYKAWVTEEEREIYKEREMRERGERER